MGGSAFDHSNSAPAAGTSGVWAAMTSTPGASRSGFRMLSDPSAAPRDEKRTTTSPVAVGVSVPAVNAAVAFGEDAISCRMADASAALTMTEGSHTSQVSRNGRAWGWYRMPPAAPASDRTALPTRKLSGRQTTTLPATRAGSSEPSAQRSAAAGVAPGAAADAPSMSGVGGSAGVGEIP